MSRRAVTLGSFLPAQLKPPEQAPEPAPSNNAGQPRPQQWRCRCEGPFDLCWRYPASVPNAVCKPTWDRLLAPFQFKGREWTIVELRSLWPHTVQALNERLLKGRMERTLKEDLQDDLQVLVDLIQHSCKPHPRPPRAGMKTLIVQGRILAEAIAQDALFQLDPTDPSAPRPDRDLVDLINRLREHHPTSLLAPALHVLRTLGNTAVHLDRDSARLTDGEIGDAAAVCCRLVVLVVDAYMHMCANLHRHEETEDALAQPLLEAPVAPIPAPNVLLRQREPTPPPEEAPAGPVAAAIAAPMAPPPTALPPPTAALAPPRPCLRTSTPERVLVGRQGGTTSGGGGEGNELAATRSGGGAAAAAPGARRNSCSGASAVGGSGGRRSTTGSADSAGRVPYSLVTCDWSAVQHHSNAPAAAASNGGGSGGASPRDDYQQQRQHVQPALGSRGWWPPAAAVGEAPVAPLLPTPMALLRRTTEGGGAGQGLAAGPEAEQSSSRPSALPPHAAVSVANWVQDHPMPYGLAGAFWSTPGGSGGAAAVTVPANQFRRLSSGSGGGDAGGGSTAASQLPLSRAPAAVAFVPGHTSTAPFNLAGGAASVAVSSSSAVAAAATTVMATAAPAPTSQTDPWVNHGRGQQHPAGGSPRRCPIYLTNGDANGNGNGNSSYHTSAAAVAVNASWSFSTRGGSPPTAHRSQTPPGHPPSQPPPPGHPPSQPGHPPSPSPPPPPHQQTPQYPQQQQQPLGAGTGPGPGSGASGGGGGGGAPPLGPSEASKRLLQLCATAQPPPGAKVEKLLQAGATMAFTDKSGMTALHMACYWCHLDAARLLLGRQPSAAGAADREERTPLWVAAQRGHAELAGVLLGLPEGAVQVDVPNSAGVTPLRVAAAQGHCQVVGELLRAGANVDVADKDGFTPLYVAAARSQLEVVRLLLAAGAAVDRADKGQRTPLWAALHPGGAAKAEVCPERRAAVVRSLLAAGADVYLLADPRDRDYCWQLLAQSIAAGE